MKQLPFEEYDAAGIDALSQNTGRPIPGQSLTNSPDESYPWESPPEFTNFKTALEYITGELLNEEVYMPIMEAVDDGVPLSDITTQLLYVGFREGKWNPDLLLLLVEPVMYVLMALAEKADIEYVLYGGEEEDEEEDTVNLAEQKAKNISDVAREKMGNVSEVPQGALPSNIVEQIKSLDISPGLLERQPMSESESLLQR
jgi:hypothetical protein